MGDQAKYGLWGSNVKTGKYLPGGCRGQISGNFLDLAVITLGGINLFELFLTKMMICDSLDAKWYKMSDFAWLGDIVKFIMIMSEFGEVIICTSPTEMCLNRVLSNLHQQAGFLVIKL